MRLMRNGMYHCPVRIRATKARLWAWLTMLCFMSSCSIVYFIYTSPGRANQYLYQFKKIQNHIFNSIQSGNFLRVGISTSEADEEFRYEPKDYEFLPANFTWAKDELCPEKLPEMRGAINVNLTEVPLAEINEQFESIITKGGSWKPDDCIAKYKVAVLVPFRNRPTHLPILLRHIIPMMMSQRLDFTIFLIEQRGEYPFNRAMLFNVGFQEVNKLDPDFECFIFHDVDHIPENDRNYYGCSNMPRHYAEELDIHAYKLEYSNFFGGVSGVTKKQLEEVNGYSNQFWGWGGEDDDFYNRITVGSGNKYNISRPPFHYGRYSSIKRNHVQEAMFLGRFSLLKTSITRMSIDGLNSVYQLPNAPIINYEQLYTNISVQLAPVKNLQLTTP